MLRLAGSTVYRNPASRRNGMAELLDCAAPRDLLSGNLREIRLINRFLGWTGATVRQLDKLVRETGLTDMRVLDVATGSGDLPRAMLRHAKRRGWRLDAHGLDASTEVLDEARRYLDGHPVALHAGDARALPFVNRSFDFVTCALALHHFVPEDATRVLGEAARVARHGVLVVDLERSLLSYLGALALRVVLRNPMTRHDAPASVLRAYTKAELRQLLAEAGLGGFIVRRQFPFRLVAVMASTDSHAQSGEA